MATSTRSPIRVLCTAILTPTLLALASGCDGEVRFETLEFEASDLVEQITIDSGSGNIDVIAEPGRDHVDVEAEVHGEHTQLRWHLDAGLLSLDQRCPPSSLHCAVDWTVRVPADGLASVDLSLDTGSGEIRVDGITGNVRADSGSGNVALRHVYATNLQVDTGSGNVDIVGCVADVVGADAGSGNITVSLTQIPGYVELDTGSGNATLIVPRAPYRLALDSNSGNIDVSGVIEDSSAAQRVVIDTGSGNINVEGREG